MTDTVNTDRFPGHDCTGFENCVFCKLWACSVDFAELELGHHVKPAERNLQKSIRALLAAYGWRPRAKAKKKGGN